MLPASCIKQHVYASALRVKHQRTLPAISGLYRTEGRVGSGVLGVGFITNREVIVRGYIRFVPSYRFSEVNMQ